MLPEAEFRYALSHPCEGVFSQPKLLPLLADGGRIVEYPSGLTRIVMANRAPMRSANWR